MSERAETGPMKFGDDWTGVFIRGDNAAGYLMALTNVLRHPGPFTMDEAALHGLLGVLRSSHERVGHLSDTQLMKPFGEAVSDPARFTPVDEGKACGSAEKGLSAASPLPGDGSQ